MTTINERFKFLRKQLKLSQEAFGQEIGLSRGEVNNIDRELTIPKDFTIQMICREFGVSEEWLRNGTGDMFVPQTEDEELAKLVGDFLQDETPEFKKKLVTLIIKMDDDELQRLQGYADFLLNKKESE